MMRGILFIAYLYPPVGNAGIPAVQRIKRFLRYIAVENMHIITIDPKYYPAHIGVNEKTAQPINGEIVHRTGTLDFFQLLLKVQQGIRSALRMLSRPAAKSENRRDENEAITRNPSRVSRLKDLISSLLTYPDFASPWLMPAIVSGLQVIRRNDIGAILATGMPWTSLVIGSILKLLTRKKLIVDFRDPWVGNPYINKNAMIEFLDSKFESLVVRTADVVIANTGILESEMAARYPDIRDRLMVLPNGYDIIDFENISAVQLPEKRFNITHAGLLYRQRDPMILLEAIHAIRKNHPHIGSTLHFYHIGGMNLDYDLREFCRHKGILDNVTILDYMTHEDCLGYLAASDALLVIQPGTRTQIPSKLYEYIYLGKPVITIAERDGALAELVSQHSFGEVVEPDDREGLIRYLYKLASAKEAGIKTKLDYDSKSMFDANNLLYELRCRLVNL